MTQAAPQAWAFYRDIAKSRLLWTLRDGGGFPAPKTPNGQRSQPFWSTRSRVMAIIENVPAYKNFSPVEITWDDFCQKWVPGLESDGVLVGVNWSGPRARGYDVAPRDVQRNVEHLMAETPQER